VGPPNCPTETAEITNSAAGMRFSVQIKGLLCSLFLENSTQTYKSPA
jgi:hypothetical protein